MSTKHRASTSKKACVRCSTQKRRCDRVTPDCGLCARLGQRCKYEMHLVSSWDPASPLSLVSDLPLGSTVLTECHLREAIVQKLGLLTLEDTLSLYRRAIEPWFPIVSISRLQSRLLLTWDESPLDVAVLGLSIVLLTTAPPSSLESDYDASKFKSLYLYTKNSLALTEGLGINSLLVIQSRELVTLFEVAHGYYPAAYISIGATVRAAEALEIHPEPDSSQSRSLEGAQREETVLTWCGILILDRYITIQSGTHPSLTHSRSPLLHDSFKAFICSTHQPGQDPTSPICRLARLLESSSLLDKIHTALNNPTVEHGFNMEELILTVQTIINLTTILIEDIGDSKHLYSGGLGLCNTALLLAFENGSKLPRVVNSAEDCNSIATASLTSSLSTITTMVETFITDAKSVDFNLLPPFVTFLVYKAAAVVTNRLFLDIDWNAGIKDLRTLRSFLQIVAKRWVGCGRFLELLDEDTTPRIMKAIEQRR